MADNPVPTRSILIETKRKILLSKSGHKLLKMKRDGLMHELGKILDDVKGIRRTLVAEYVKCQQRMAIAQAVEGRIGIKSIAHTQQSVPNVVMGSKNIMGVVVPTVQGESVTTTLQSRGYGLLGTSPQVDDVVDSFEALLEIIIQAAELETTLKRLLEDIEKTKRRVNALEFKVIPELEAQRTYISMRLEEMEREGIFGLKKIKEKAAKKAEEERRARLAAEAGDAGSGGDDAPVAEVTA